MSTSERIFHALLFEFLALSLLIPLASLFSSLDMGHMTGLAIGLALLAMCWNYVFNLMFDKKFGTNRIERSLALRIGHGFLFELVLLVISLPIIMWTLNLDVITALILDVGIIIFFLVYSIVYNWCYDLAKHHLVST